MDKKNCIGVILCGSLFVGGFFLTEGPVAYWNLAAFTVVVSGVLVALLLSYPFSRIKSAFAVAREVYLKPQAGNVEIVDTLLDLSVRSRVDGVLSLEKMRAQTSIAFLKTGLMFLVDNYKEEEIREFLTTEMDFFNLRRQQCERIFQTLARMAPALGVAGSVIGLIGLLMGLRDTALIFKHIPAAFISTLYGLILGNLVFAPVAEHIHFNTRNELLNQKLIMEGIVAIGKEQNLYKLEKKLASFLSPAERAGRTGKAREIARRYLNEKREAASEKDRLMKEGILAKAS
jgi:chemotaxis protein MotA